MILFLITLIFSIFDGICFCYDIRCPEVLSSIGVTISELEGTWFESKRTLYSPENPQTCNSLEFKKGEFDVAG